MDIRWAFVSVFFLTLVSVGSSLKCYECGPVLNETGSCGSVQKISECADIFNACVNQTVTLPGQNTTFSRSCGVKYLCDHMYSPNLCYSCTTDLCNSSTAMVPSVVAVTIFFVFKLFV